MFDLKKQFLFVFFVVNFDSKFLNQKLKEKTSSVDTVDSLPSKQQDCKTINSNAKKSSERKINKIDEKLNAICVLTNPIIGQ